MGSNHSALGCILCHCFLKGRNCTQACNRQYANHCAYTDCNKCYRKITAEKPIILAPDRYICRAWSDTHTLGYYKLWGCVR